MEVRTIELTPFRIPLRHPVAFGTGRLESAEHVLVQVHSDAGIVGTAEAIPRPMVYGETTVSVVECVRRLIAPRVVGVGLFELERMSWELRNVVGNPAAKSAVELAMYDAMGQALGVPAHRLLGGFSSCAECTVLLGWGEPAVVVEQAVAARERWGVASFKMKVGIDLDTDVATACGLRSALGEGVLIYADANHAFTPDQAMRFLDATADCALAWFEEPCPSSARIGRERVVAHSRIPIVGDESCADLAAASAEVLGGRSTMVSLKVARTAILASGRIRAMCEAAGVEVVVGSQGDSGIGTLAGAALVAASPFTGRHPAELLYFLDLEDDLLAEPPVIVGGRLELSSAPGFGIVIDAAKLRRFAAGETIVCG